MHSRDFYYFPSLSRSKILCTSLKMSLSIFSRAFSFRSCSNSAASRAARRYDPSWGFAKLKADGRQLIAFPPSNSPCSPHPDTYPKPAS